MTLTPDVVQVARELEEGTAAETNIGDPLAAADSDNDILLYSIVEDPTDTPTTSDDEKFDIDSRIRSVEGQDRARTTSPSPTRGSVANSSGIRRRLSRAKDPSGAMGDATVTITLMDVNEAPLFGDDSSDDLVRHGE